MRVITPFSLALFGSVLARPPPQPRVPFKTTTTSQTPPDTPWTNPISDEWYADPDAIRFGDTYWVYVTVSESFSSQAWFDAYSSQDLITWEYHPHVFESGRDSDWAKDAFWAPCTIERDGKFYFYYTANNPVSNETLSGVGVAVADTPAGPFKDLVDGPILKDKIGVDGNPMDQQIFIDSDGEYYIVWGGTNAFIQPLNEDMHTLDPWADGTPGFKEITPEGYVEGAFMLKHKDMYYFMWSEGGYGTPDYRVAYGMSESLTGPFKRIGLVLSKEGSEVADGPGHHSVFTDEGGGYYVAYHRRIIGDEVADHRVVAIDRMFFEEDGRIKPVIMT